MASEREKVGRVLYRAAVVIFYFYFSYGNPCFDQWKKKQREVKKPAYLDTVPIIINDLFTSIVIPKSIKLERYSNQCKFIT